LAFRKGCGAFTTSNVPRTYCHRGACL
jgi:hypothetical protein